MKWGRHCPLLVKVLVSNQTFGGIAAVADEGIKVVVVVGISNLRDVNGIVFIEALPSVKFSVPPLTQMRAIMFVRGEDWRFEMTRSRSPPLSKSPAVVSRLKTPGTDCPDENDGNEKGGKSHNAAPHQAQNKERLNEKAHRSSRMA